MHIYKLCMHHSRTYKAKGGRGEGTCHSQTRGFIGNDIECSLIIAYAFKAPMTPAYKLPIFVTPSVGTVQKATKDAPIAADAPFHNEHRPPLDEMTK